MASRVKGIVSLAAASIVGLGTLVGGAPASAADLGTITIDCTDGNPAPTNISGTVGDTFALLDDDDGGSNCTSVASSTAGIVTWSATPGGTDDPTTLPGTGGAGGFGGTFYFTLLAPGTTTISYDNAVPATQSFTITVTEGSGSGGSSGPVMQLQQLPIPVSGNCADADPNNALWAKTNATPWTLQWGEWSEPVPFSGFVCGRWVWAYGTP